MKILHVLTAPRAEGTPKLVLDWLLVSGIDQEVLFLKNDSQDLVEDFIKTRVRVSYCKAYGNGWRKYFRAYNQVKEKISIIQPDLLICWTQGMASSITLAAKSKGVKNLVHFGCTPSYGNLWQIFYNYFINFSLIFSDSKIICASHHITRVARKLPFIPTKLFHTVHNSFQIDRFVKQPNSKRSKISHKMGIMVGNLEPVKNHASLIKAWSIIAIKGLNMQLLIVGGGSLKNDLTNLVDVLNVRDRITFTGAVNNVDDYLHQSSVFIFPTSAAEGFGTVLLEALASGLKIVASDVPACREVLQDGKYGTLVPPNNPEALAEAIITAFKEPLTEEQLINQIAYASQFTPEIMMRQYLEIAGFSVEAKKLTKC